MTITDVRPMLRLLPIPDRRLLVEEIMCDIRHDEIVLEQHLLAAAAQEPRCTIELHPDAFAIFQKRLDEANQS